MSTAQTAPSDVRVRQDVELPRAEVVHDAEDVVEHPLPHLRGDDGRDRPRNEHHRAHRAAALEVRVDDERDDQAEHELERDRDQGELDRDPDRVAEDRVVPEVAIVLKPDPLRRLEPGEEFLVREALVDGLAERVQRDEPDRGERRQEQQALELRPATTAAGCGSGYRGHETIEGGPHTRSSLEAAAASGRAAPAWT
jgi:hypothetical protein